MKKNVRVVMFVALLGIAVSPVTQAAPLHLSSSLRGLFAGTNMVRFNLRNDSHQAMDLKVGDTVMTLEAGATKSLRLPIGTRIVTNAADAHHATGVLLAEVSLALNDAVVAIH